MNDETAEKRKEDKEDQFSDVENDLDDSFAVNINLIKNQTTTSNFKFNINIQPVNEQENNRRKSRSGDVRLNKLSDNLKEKKDRKEDKMNKIDQVTLEDQTLGDKGKSIDNEEGEGEEGEGEEGEGEGEGQDDQIQQVGKINAKESIPEFYEKIRQHFAQTGVQWEDPDFPDDPTLFCNDQLNPDGEFEIEFERPLIDEENLEFFDVENSSTNIDYEFKISRGLLNDKFFVGALMMLFKRRDEFFTDLVVDFENAKDNIKAGFCGFLFFINGEWKTVTVDTRLPVHQRGEFSLSKTLTPKAPFWISLFEKAYAKLFHSYTVLNNTLLKDFLVDFTGGWSKMIKLPKEHAEDKQKKLFYDEIKRCLAQGYLIGCMKQEDDKIKDELNESTSDKDQEEEQILSNSIYTIIDLQEYENLKLIYLVSHWDKGKVSHPYGPEDETWEANKKLTEKLQYMVSTTDGTFWMLFDEWMTNFNSLYYCRIFPESWSEYDIPGVWEGDSSGGEPQKVFPWKPEQRIQGKGVIGKKSTVGLIKGTLLDGLQESPNFFGGSPMKQKSKIMSTSKQLSSPSKQQGGGQSTSIVTNPIIVEPKQEIQLQCDFKRVIITDTEDSFFLNPQYKIELSPGNKIIISLMQEDKKMSQADYIKCNFILIHVKGRYSRVWDILENNIIKKAIDDNDEGKRREIVMILDYYEAVRRINNQNSKKLPKNEKLCLNLIPYMEYSDKFEIEKKGNLRQFKPYHPEALYWLRIFSNEHVYINKLKNPYEVTVNGTWTNEVSSGGPRFVPHKNKLVENAYWPINPQYLLKFGSNTKTKIILKKVSGRFANEDTNVGLMITKPTIIEDDANSGLQGNKNKKRSGGEEKEKRQMKVKLEPIQRIMKSTNKILEIKPIQFEKILPKLSVNNSEMIIESSYNNNYCASIQATFSRLDSPIIIIPTLATRDSTFDYKISIYSTKPTELFSLYNDNCTTLIGEWNEENAGGSLLSMDSNKSDGVNYSKRYLTWMDNPKFLIQFDSKDWIKDLEFEVVLSRVESIWKRRLSLGMLNAMMSIYIFKYEREKWKENAVPYPCADFMPKNEVRVKYTEAKADPKGYIIMPITYGKDVYGPFALMVKCTEKFKLTKFTE